MQGVTSTNSVLSNLEGEVDKNRQRVDAKLEDLSDQGRGRTTDIQRLQHQIDELHELIQKFKQGQARGGGQKAMIAQLEAAENMKGTGGDFEGLEGQDIIDNRENIREMREEIKELA